MKRMIRGNAQINADEKAVLVFNHNICAYLRHLRMTL